jgi:toxin CcdB
VPAQAQWDVYRNPNERSREELPYVVDAQSGLLTGLPRGFVVPLAAVSGAAGLPRRMSPRFQIEGRSMVLVPHNAGSLPARSLRRPVPSLRAQSHLIIDALDAVLSGV